jgi:predicted transcriptional regulator
MEVKISPELEARLATIAMQQGRDRESLVRELIEEYLKHLEWFHKEVDTGLAEVRRGETVEHEQVAARMEKLIARKQRRP